MMKLLLWCQFLYLFINPILVGPKVDESEIRFQIVNAGLTVNGTLSGMAADIQFDTQHPEKASIQASVPVSTIKTGITLRDKHLQKPDYFDAEKYPAIILQSKTIQKTGQNSYEGLFDLTMKGIHREVKLPFTVSPANEFAGNLRVNRLDFNLGKPSLILADDVTITIRAKLTKGS